MFAYRPPEPPDVDPVEVGHDFTDDTGTVTFLVNTEGPYTVRAIMSGGDKSVDVVAECGVNNITVQFGTTDKICLEVTKVGGLPAPNVEFTVKDSLGSVVGTCQTGETGQLKTRCCVSIPGPGTYNVEADAIGIQMPSTVIVGDKDCGDKIVEGSVPGEAQTDDCPRHFCLTICGCPGAGKNITVTIQPVGKGVAGAAGEDGCATLWMSEDDCDHWIGSDYSIQIPGRPLPLTGTVTSEPMSVSWDPGANNWCYPDCYGPSPDQIYWTAGSGYPWWVPDAMMSRAPDPPPGYFAWHAFGDLPCLDGAWFFEVRLEVKRAWCPGDPDPQGTFRLHIYGPPDQCQDQGFSVIDQTYQYFQGTGSKYCPVNLAIGGGTLTE